MNILLSIPIFNEENSIEPVIENTIQHLPPEIKRILLINDGSSDSSKDIIYSIVKKYQILQAIHRKKNEGYGASMIEAMKYAVNNGFDYLITMDCDFQHRPEDLKNFCDFSEDIDVVSGSRYLPDSKSSGSAPQDRVLINTRITAGLNRRFQWNLSDSFCGFKRYRMKNINPDLFSEKGYAFPMEFWTYSKSRNLSIAEISVSRIYTTDDRSFGEDLDKIKKRYKYYMTVLQHSLKKFL